MERKKIKLSSEKVVESRAAECYINSLPEELLLEIFSYLSQNQLICRVARVCRKWNEYTKSPTLWKKVCMKFQSCESYYKASTVFPEKFSACTTHIRFIFLKCGLEFDFLQLCLKLNERCLHLHTLVLNHANIGADFSSVIAYCGHFLPTLKVLGLYGCDFKPCDPPYAYKSNCYKSFCKIEVLEISACDFEERYVHAFSKMPYLKKLYMDMTRVWCTHLFDSFYLPQLEVLGIERSSPDYNTFWYLQSMKESLNVTELYMCHTRVNNRDMNFISSIFPQLKVLCIYSCSEVSYLGISYLMESCHSLQCIYVSEDGLKSYTEYCMTHGLLREHTSMLKILKLNCAHGCHSAEIDYLGYF